MIMKQIKEKVGKFTTYTQVTRDQTVVQLTGKGPWQLITKEILVSYYYASVPHREEALSDAFV